MAPKRKITTGPNGRPVDETISQTGGGLPDDSSRGLQTDEAQLTRMRRSLGEDRSQPYNNAGSRRNPEAVPSGTPGAGENICRRCAGSGRIDEEICPDCQGTGKVTTPLGGG